jgi:4-amino-4-deoxy-L-arabinose transferase-like glycosyltransferase
MNTEKHATKIDLAALFVISSLVLLWGLGTGSLTSWDEGLYAGVSREILKTGNWLDLRWAGLPWSDKPPLYMWMTVIFYKLLGVNELAVRLFSALSGIGTVLVTYLFAKKLYPRGAAISSALILLTTWHFIWSSRVGMLDIPLTFFVTLSLFLFKVGEEKKICLFFSPVAFALAFLTKGMAAAVVPVTIIIYLAFSGNFKILKERALLFGILAAALILGAWHWAVFAHYGEKFIQDYFVKHLLTRTTTAVEGHTGNLLTYLGVLPNKGRPWSAVGLTLIPFIAWMMFTRKGRENALPLIWACVVIVLFSLVQTKIHWYIMPVYPALAMMTGWAVEKLFKKYDFIIICSLALCSLLYLSVDKGIYNLDYSPEIKKTAIDVKKTLSSDEKVYLYDISDPGMQFYLGDVGENVRGEDNLNILLASKGRSLLTVRGKLNTVSGPGRRIIFENGDFVLLRTQ